MTQRIHPIELKKLCSRIFTAAGIPDHDSRMMAEVLVTADMYGVHSHGVVRSARYIKCIRAGGIQPSGNLKLLSDSGAALQFSAMGGLGIPASVRAVDILIDRAGTHPIAIATVNHSDHFGAAGFYAARGADAGLVMMAMSNTIPLMAAPGGRAKIIGNNPFAYAAPGRNYRRLLFDICMTQVASGKIEIAASEGKTIPEGWILDAAGKPTTDPLDIYHGGIMLPCGRHKGYGLAVMVELLSGVLSLGGILSGVHSWNTVPGQDANTGHCFIALNPRFLGGDALFRSRVDAMIDELKSSPVIPGERVLYPGELEMEREKDALANGIPLPEASWEELAAAGEMVSVEVK